jgi:hypothetical protein
MIQIMAPVVYSSASVQVCSLAFLSISAIFYASTLTPRSLHIRMICKEELAETQLVRCGDAVRRPSTENGEGWRFRWQYLVVGCASFAAVAVAQYGNTVTVSRRRDRSEFSRVNFVSGRGLGCPALCTLPHRLWILGLVPLTIGFLRNAAASGILHVI